MNVERTHIGHQTRYTAEDGSGLRGMLIFDTGEDGKGPAAWQILLPGPGGTQDLYGTRDFLSPDADKLSGWLAPIAGADAAADLAAAVDSEPPPQAGWRRTSSG